MNSPTIQRVKSSNNKEARKPVVPAITIYAQTRNYNTHRVKLIGQITTSRVSRKGCNKFRIKSQKAKITYQSKQYWYNHGNQSHRFPIRSSNSSSKVNTHSPSDSECKHSKSSKKAESDLRIANYDQHNQS